MSEALFKEEIWRAAELKGGLPQYGLGGKGDVRVGGWVACLAQVAFEFHHGRH
jgi:hypothetical protein